MKVITLPCGMQVTQGEVIGIEMLLEGLLFEGHIQVLQELRKKVEDPEYQFSPSVFEILKKRAICHSDGLMHANISAIIDSILKPYGESVEVISISLQAQTLVNTLAEQELSALVLGIGLEEGNSLEGVNGYDKVASFCHQGIPSSALVDALFNAADVRFKESQ